jgi:hypothetical protein
MARKAEHRRAGELHASPPERSWGYFFAQCIFVLRNRQMTVSFSNEDNMGWLPH